MTQHLSFIVGRQELVERFDQMLSGQTEYQLLNIYGPGGIGKTVVGQKLVSHAKNKQIPVAMVDGSRPDLTPDRLLYSFMEGLVQTSLGEALENAFRDFNRESQDYLVVSQVLQQGGGVQALFDVAGTVKEQSGFAAILDSLGSAVTESVRNTLWNRFALERYLRSVERNLTASFVKGLHVGMEAVKQPIVLLIDTYEEMEELDDWVCRSLFPSLPSQAFLVILGRNQFSKVNFDWNEHEAAIHTMPLPELDEVDAKAYLRHFGLTDATTLDQVYRYTGGYSLLLVLFRNLAREAGGWEQISVLEISADRDRIATSLLERILREERVAEVQSFLEKGVVARWFDPETISVILEVNLAEARTIYDKLSRHSFVERHPYGLKFHDIIRELLLDRLKFDRESDYNRLTQRLMNYYAKLDQGQEQLQETSQALAEMLAFGDIHAVTFSQAFASLLGLPQLPHDAVYHRDVYPVVFDAASFFSGVRSLAHLPSLFIRTSTFLQIPVDELRQYLQQITGPAHRIFLFIYLPKPDSLEEVFGGQDVVKKLQQVWAYDCVSLGREELQKIVFSADPKAVFRKLVLNNG